MTKKTKEDAPSQARLMVYHVHNENDPEIGRSYEVPTTPPGFVIGSRESADVQVPPDESLMPVTARLYQHDNHVWHMENLEESNNIAVNEVLSRARKLNDGDLIRASSVTFRFLDGKGKESTFHRELQRIIGTDVLTGISNPRQLNEELLKAMAYCKRSKRPFCLVLIDFDNFSVMNNTYGHAAGDKALREMTARIRQNIRTEDTFGRYGGEEFLLGLPNLAKDKAFSFIERVRKKVVKDPIEVKGKLVPITFSAGLAEWDGKIDLPTLKEQADALMYQAKKRGKNQVVVAEE